MTKVWLLSDTYYPEETATGYFLTVIAEGLARTFAVEALCGQPNYSRRGERAPRHETHNGVEITRCRGTTFLKDSLPLRLINLLTITGSMFLKALRLFRKGDVVLVATNPPLLPYAALIACRLRGAKCVLLVQDVYPEAIVAAGVLPRRSPAIWALLRLSKLLYARMDRISVLGRDMAALVCRKLKREANPRVVIITNWAQLELIQPLPREENPLLKELGLLDKFVIQYAGNMGRVHDIETLLEAARLTENKDSEVHWLFIGSGAKKAWLESTVEQRGLTNVTLLPNRPRSEQPIFLSACDVAVIALMPGMSGIGVPSRMYNIMASGKPMIASVDADSEVALVINEERIGWVIAPGHPEVLVESVLAAKADRALLMKMELRARSVAEGKYGVDTVLAAYHSLVEQLTEGTVISSHG